MEKQTHNLTIVSVSKSYSLSKCKDGPALRALDNISFHLSNGLYGLLGPNGSGKSTLINIITGNLAPDEGVVFWDNNPIMQQGKEFRKILGYVPQQQNLYDGFTGQRFLQYICVLKDIPHTYIQKEVNRVAEKVNLIDELNKRISAYSGGMKQRLLAAAAMIGYPKLLILDEPTAGLDPKERVRYRDMMKMYSKHAIILFATHVVSDIENVADGIILLKKGKVALAGSPKELITQVSGCNGLEELYLSVFGNT